MLNKTFRAKLQKSANKGGRTYVVWPGSIKFSFMAMGDGTHKLPVRGDIRKVIGKEVGDTVAVLLEERISIPSADGSSTIRAPLDQA
jgi:hypothetical protein